MPESANWDLLMTSYFVLKFVFGGFWIGWILVRRDVREAFDEVSRGAWIALVVLVAGYLFLLQPFVPHAVWQPNTHGAAAAAGLMNGAVPSDMMFTHGTGWFILLHSLQRYLFLDLVTVFTTAYIVSAASLVLLFLVARRLLRSDLAALASAAILALSPARLRIAATETQSVPVEFFLLASLLAFLLYIDSRKVRFLVLGLAGTALMLQCRLEFLAFGPYLIGLLFLAVRPGALLDPLRSRAGLAAMAAFVLAMTPWIVRLAVAIDPRTGEMSGHAGDVLHALRQDVGDWRVFLHPFFDPRYGPPLFMVLFGAGAVVLARRNPRSLVLAVAALLPMTAFSGIYSDSVSTHFRTHAVSLCWAALVAGAGLDGIAGMTRRTPVRRGLLAVLAVASVAGLLPHADLLDERYSSQVEFNFLLEARERLPGKSRVAILDGTDDPDNTLGREYQRLLLAPPRHQDTVTVIGLGALLDSPPDAVDGRETFVYLGAPCYIVPRRGRDPEPPEDASWENARCVRVRNEWVLDPVIETTLPRASNGFVGDHIQGDNRPIGLYRLRGRRT